MPRSISVTRRKPDLIDLFVDRRAGVIGYEFSVADNFDSALSVFQEIPIYGYASPSVRGNATINKYAGAIGQPYRRNKTRFIFAPSDYTASVAAMRDDKPIFLSIKERTSGGLGSAEALHMVMASGWDALHPIQLHGDAPSGADLTASLEIQLPMQCTGWSIQNDGAAPLYVAFDRGAVVGPEYLIPAPGANWNNNLDQYATSVSQIFIRGSGGTATVSAIFTARNEQK